MLKQQEYNQIEYEFSLGVCLSEKKENHFINKTKRGEIEEKGASELVQN